MNVIMEDVQRYVPVVGLKMKPIFFGGNQLTHEFATSDQVAKAQSADTRGRLKWLIPKVEYWHALMWFYQVR